MLIQFLPYTLDQYMILNPIRPYNIDFHTLLIRKKILDLFSQNCGFSVYNTIGFCLNYPFLFMYVDKKSIVMLCSLASVCDFADWQY
jgi:hypothetical protein